MKRRDDRIEYGGCSVGKAELNAIIKTIVGQGYRRWTIGPESVALEQELAKKAGVKYGVVVNSGSSALLVGIQALKLPKGSKIIIPALTFPTAYSSILHAGHLPVVIDCDRDTLNVSYGALEQAIKDHPDTKAVVVINIAGNTVDLRKVRKIVGERKIVLDNCDAFGASIGKKYAEAYADVSAISMHAAHIISMGEGGAVLTDDKNIADVARKIREWGRASGSDQLTTLEGFPEDYRERYVFEEIGYNLKPLELQCAMGRIQLKKLESFKRKREKVHNLLTKVFKKYEGYFNLVEEDAKADHCWFAFAFHCPTIPRAEVMEAMEAMNIETRTVFSGNILRHPAYKNEPHLISGSLENCDYVMANTMFIGSPPFYTSEQITYIDRVLHDICHKWGAERF